MSLLHCLVFVAASYLHLLVQLVAPTIGATGLPPQVIANDNRHAAGRLSDDTLTLELRAAAGELHPEGADGPGIVVEAFGEVGRELMAPAPLVRVSAGTRLHVGVRNDLAFPLVVHGLCERRGERCAPLSIAPGARGETTFVAGLPGTYHYWATSSGAPLQGRAVGDTQLSGAFIVDEPGAVADDRVLVVTDWSNLTREQLKIVEAADDPGVAFEGLRPAFAFFINGLSWPATERLTYTLGESIRWRVVNLSSQTHPLHLHGAYFSVDGLGNGSSFTVAPSGRVPRVVTQVMRAGDTMNLTWQPEHAGNWLLHCHIVHHVAPERRLPRPGSDGASAHDPHGDHLSTGMASMVVGVTIVDPMAEAAAHAPTSASSHDVPRRPLTMVLHTEAKRFGDQPAYGFALVADRDAPAPTSVSIPGPPLVLTRDQPVTIELVNRLPEATAIHWHGMELESYYDGVHGWSGQATRVTPLIPPGGTFLVRFTPRRTGTFIYHTHMHDQHQLRSGMYGALLVVDPDERYDDRVDHVWTIGRGGPAMDAPIVVDGRATPQFSWTAGTTHRVRLINITADDIVSVSLGTSEGPITWRPLTKDGAPVPPGASPGPARQLIAAGETYDFEVDVPQGRRAFWLELRSTGGRWLAQGRVNVR